MVGGRQGQPGLKDYEASQTEFAEGILSAIKARAAKMGLKVNTAHVPNSYPASAIVDTAQKLGCNLIVMASHGRRGSSAWKSDIRSPCDSNCPGARCSLA